MTNDRPRLCVFCDLGRALHLYRGSFVPGDPDGKTALMKDVPNVLITVARPDHSGYPDRYSICEMDGLWVVTVEHWHWREQESGSWAYDHDVVYLSAYVDLPLALVGLRETGEVYGAWEVVEYAESLIKVIRN